MRALRAILMFLVGFLSVLVLVFLVLTAWGWENVWTRSFGDPDLGAITFDGYRKGTRPNEALACPPGLCLSQGVDIVPPTYSVDADTLKRHLLVALRAEPSLELVDETGDPAQLRFVQRSRLLRFPDTIRVQFVPLGDDRSTLALQSQSQVGRSDLGVNRARIRRWLSYLKPFEAEGTG